MRRVVLVALTAGLLAGAGAPALAGPKLPKLPDPSNCQEVQDFLGIDNVRECGDPAS